MDAKPIDQFAWDRLAAMRPQADAKPDVGALVREIEFTMPPNKDVACGYDELLDRCHAALLALQAEVARLTQERDLLTSCGMAELMARNPSAMEFVSNLEAERDRLTQENARLAGEVAALRKPHQDPLGDALNSGDGVYRP